MTQIIFILGSVEFLLKNFVLWILLENGDQYFHSALLLIKITN